MSVDRKSKIYQWVELALKTENVQNLKVFTSGASQKGDGFIGDIVFIKAEGVKTDGIAVQYDLVIKRTKENVIGAEKEQIIKRAFEKEIYFYAKVVPEFKKFEEGKGLNPFSSLAKCFGSFSFDNQQAIILQNLKTLGYTLCNGKTLDAGHRALTLESYGHFHAISFMMKNDRPEHFQKLCVNIFCNNKAYLATLFGEVLASVEDLISQLLIQNNEHRLLEVFKNRIQDGVVTSITELLRSGEKDEKAIFCHADSWINNFMFQYDVNDKDKKHPSKVAFVDFQLSVPNSPVYDLAYHLYSVLGAEDYKNIKQDLEMYYNFLSKKIRELGGDPAKIFPFSALIEHWNKYSFAGFIIAVLVLLLTVSDKEETIDLGEIDRDSKNLIINGLKPHIRKRFFERVLNAVKHNLSGEI